MAGIPNYVVAENRQKLMDYIKSNADESGYAVVTTHQVRLCCGQDPQTLGRHLEQLQKIGTIEYAKEGRGQYLVRVLPEKASEGVIKVSIAPEQKIRTCPKCKTQAPDYSAQFCFKCGASLLSEKELLRKEFHNTLGYICRVVKNSTDLNKIMTTMAKVEKFAFAEEGEDDE